MPFSQINDKCLLFISCFFLMMFLFFPAKMYAQKDTRQQAQVWYAYFNDLKFSNSLRLGTDVQERQFIKPVGAQGSLHFRTILYHNLGHNWEAGTGLGLFFNSPQNIPSSSDLAVPELRPTVDILNRQKAGKLQITNRLRMEARYFHEVQNNELTGGFEFNNFRCRYQVATSYPIIKNEKNKPVVLVKLQDEVMINFGKKIVANTFDQNRFYAGLGFEVFKNCSLELGYLNWFQETSNGTTYYNRNIFRIGINHQVDLSKTKTKTKKGDQ